MHLGLLDSTSVGRWLVSDMLRGLGPLCIRVHRPSPVGAHAMHVTPPSAAAPRRRLLFAPCSLLLARCSSAATILPVGWFLTPRSPDKGGPVSLVPGRAPRKLVSLHAPFRRLSSCSHRPDATNRLSPGAASFHLPCRRSPRKRVDRGVNSRGCSSRDGCLR